jgi:class 3 adenylate cyclase/HAMP domain-containing protein
MGRMPIELPAEGPNRIAEFKPGWIIWLPVLVFFINLAGLGLLAAYSLINLRPDLSAVTRSAPLYYLSWNMVLAVLVPTAASLVHVWAIIRWLPGSKFGRVAAIPSTIAQRAGNAPLALAGFSLIGWSLVTALAVVRMLTIGRDIPMGLAAHFVIRPVLVGLIAGAATLLAADVICRAHVWPMLLAGTRIAGNGRLWRVRVSHRLFVLWLASSVVPLTAVAVTTYARVAGLDLSADPILARVVSIVLLIAVSAAFGGAWLAWLVSRSIARPLTALEAAMSRLREGRLDTRELVRATDEIGAVAEGFNLMAERLSKSYAALETRNRELAEALDRVVFLEHVKRGLDRFVPETVRHAIEENPEAPGLEKEAKDVTVLFLDIEGYARLSEELPRPALNALVERYFSLFLTSIRAEGGDINETAGDGLMIIFQTGRPEDHARAAVRAALEIRAQTTVANRDALPGSPPIIVNIGISSGECDVGATRIKGPAGERWTFTASGPVTNLAARLGDYATTGQILLAAQTADRLGDRFQLRMLGPVSLKNFSSGVVVWEAQPGERDKRQVDMGQSLPR